MALECWDESDNPGGAAPRRYFGGREMSAIALGFLAPENGSDRAFQVVNRTVRELLGKGAIRRVRPGRSGQRAEFELLLDSGRPPTAKRRLHPIVDLTERREQGVNF